MIFTWGNVTRRQSKTGRLNLRVSYDQMKVEDMVVTEWNDKVVEGKYKTLLGYATPGTLQGLSPPSASVHTHSTFATASTQQSDTHHWNHHAVNSATHSLYRDDGS